jgi:hypothetical protein
LVRWAIEEMIVRLVYGLVLLSMAGCSVDNDGANEQVTLQYNRQQMWNTAVQAGQTAKEVARGAGNVAVATGRAVRNEVGDVDVDVNVNRTRPQKAE